jgi:hypothetical protein
MTVDALVRTQRKRIFDPEEGLCIVLARLSTVGRWREMEQVFLEAPARAVKTLLRSKYRLLIVLSSYKSSSRQFSDIIFITICAPLTLLICLYSPYTWQCR